MVAALPYTQRALKQAKTRQTLTAIDRDFRRYYMRAREDWNRAGPALPLWFKLQLRRIDRRLKLQFVPGDAPGMPWPAGAWYICSRIPRTKWLAKRAVYMLVQQDGSPIPPSRDLIRVLRRARQDRRRGRLDALERQHEESMQRLVKERDEKSKRDLINRIAQTMRERNMRSYAQPRVFVAGQTS